MSTDYCLDGVCVQHSVIPAGGQLLCIGQITQFDNLVTLGVIVMCHIYYFLLMFMEINPSRVCNILMNVIIIYVKVPKLRLAEHRRAEHNRREKIKTGRFLIRLLGNIFFTRTLALIIKVWNSTRRAQNHFFRKLF